MFGGRKKYLAYMIVVVGYQVMKSITQLVNLRVCHGHTTRFDHMCRRVQTSSRIPKCSLLTAHFNLYNTCISRLFCYRIFEHEWKPRLLRFIQSKL